jgi:hypothetical protein
MPFRGANRPNRGHPTRGASPPGPPALVRLCSFIHLSKTTYKAKGTHFHYTSLQACQLRTCFTSTPCCIIKRLSSLCIARLQVALLLLFPPACLSACLNRTGGKLWACMGGRDSVNPPTCCHCAGQHPSTLKTYSYRTRLHTCLSASQCMGLDKWRKEALSLQGGTEINQAKALVFT